MTVTIRKMIDRKCKTKRCELLTKIVEEKAFNEECYEDIKHVCEEHIKVPVDIPFPVKVPHPAVYEPDTNHTPFPGAPRQPKTYDHPHQSTNLNFNTHGILTPESIFEKSPHDIDNLYS